MVAGAIAGVFLLGAAVGGGLLLARPGGLQGTSSPAPTTSPVPAPPRPSTVPTNKPSPSSTPTRKPAPDTSLRKNSLYDVDLTDGAGKCKVTVKPARPPLKNSALAPYLRQLIACMVTVLKKPLAAEGFALKTPKIKTFGARVKSSCGRSNEDDAPAFYCPSDGTIYVAASVDDDYDALTAARLGVVGLTAHEFGHHVQREIGILSRVDRDEPDSRAERLEQTRRVELQADCFSGVLLAYARKSIGVTEADERQLRFTRDYSGDEDQPSGSRADHGTSAAQKRWLFRGLDSADFGRCNTWTARDNQVK